MCVSTAAPTPSTSQARCAESASTPLQHAGECLWSARGASLAASLRNALPRCDDCSPALLCCDDPLPDVDVVARRCAWISVSGGGAAASAGFGIASAARALAGLGSTLQALQRRFQHLDSDFASLDQEGAEAVALFGGLGLGPLRGGEASALVAQAAAKSCRLAGAAALQQSSSLSLHSSVWVELPDPEITATCLEYAARDVEIFVRLAEELEAGLRAALLRITAADAALAAAACASSACSAQGALGDALTKRLRESSKRKAPAGLAFTSCAWLGLWARFGSSAREPSAMLCAISASRKDSDEQMRSLAAWAAARTGVHSLLRQLRFSRRVPSSCGAPAALDGIFHAFDLLAVALARLYEALSCLDVDVEVAGGSLPAALLAAACVQRNALEWKCRLLGSPGHVNEVISCADATQAPAPSVAEITIGLNEALAAGDALEACIVALSRRYDQAVDSLKASIEAAACAHSVHGGRCGTALAAAI